MKDFFSFGIDEMLTHFAEIVITRQVRKCAKGIV